MKSERLVKKLRELSFHHAKQLHRTHQWRRGGTLIYISKKKKYPDTYVISVLRKCGLGDDEIQAFLSAARE